MPIENHTNVKSSYLKKGFAFIYIDTDQLIKKKIDNKKLLVGHNKLKIGTLVSITNTENQKKIYLKVNKRIKYPNFYTVFITEAVADKIDLNKAIPYVEIQEIKKNKSFVAKKAKMFDEEKNIDGKAPVENIEINNISKNISSKKTDNKEFSIVIGNFYSFESAKFLKNKLEKESVSFSNKIYINKKNEKSYTLIAGPYNAINSLKNDYIILSDRGFEDLEVNLK